MRIPVLIVLCCIVWNVPVSAQKKPARNITIEGYTNRFSYYAGDSCILYLSAAEKAKVSLRIFAVDGAIVDTLKDIDVFPQQTAAVSPWSRGFGYKPVCRFKMPALKSGLYRIDHTQIHFLVKSSKKSDLVVLLPYNTMQAYCATGGKSLYDKLSSGNQASPVLSFHRPLISHKEFSLIDGFMRWMKTTAYNCRFIADPDMDNYDEISGSKILVVIGHSEYWTRKARQHFDRFVKSGGHALVLSGNTMWWQVRYNREKTQLLCYRDEKKDSIDHPLLKTVLWNKPLLQYPITKSLGSEFSGYGTKTDRGWNGLKVVLPSSPLLAGTGLRRGEIVPLASGETDGVQVSGYDTDSFPVVNPRLMGFKKVELIAFDRVSRNHLPGLHTFIVFKKTKHSGIVVNVGSTDWCSAEAFRNEWIKKITANAIDLLLAGKNIFSNEKPSKINARKDQVIQ